MPNERQRIDRLPTAGDAPARVRAGGPVAHQVDTFVAPPVGQAQALLEGLAAFNPALEKYKAYQAVEDSQEGAQARATEQPKDDSKGANWVRGYMRMDGVVKGTADQGRILEAYNTEFDKDGGNLDEFLKTRVGALTSGMTDKVFADGYNQALAPGLQKIRNMYRDYHVQQVTDRAESNAVQLLVQGFAEDLNKGKPVDPLFIETARKHYNTTMGISNSRFNDLLFDAAKKHGDEGNYAIYEMFKKDKPDGTPGMYFIPKWKEKIDHAQIRAQEVYLAKQDKATQRAKVDREERQESALFGVFDKLTKGDESGARQDFNILRNDRTLFSRASDVIKWEKLFDDTTKRESTPEMMSNETKLLARAYRGEATVDHVLQALSAGQIDNRGARRVLQDMSKIRSEQRQAAAAELSAAAAGRAAETAARVAGQAIYHTMEFKSGLNSINKGVLAVSPSKLDVFGTGTQFIKQLREQAELEYTRRAKTMQPHELPALIDELSARYGRQRKMFEEQGLTDVPNAGLIRFPTRQAAAAAARRGELNPFELEIHDQFFTERDNRAKPKHGR